jgi:hypothetical protein
MMALGAGRQASSTPMQLTRILLHRPRNQSMTLYFAHLFGLVIDLSLFAHMALHFATYN